MCAGIEMAANGPDEAYKAPILISAGAWAGAAAARAENNSNDAADSHEKILRNIMSLLGLLTGRASAWLF
jgi:hypothetical protein